MWHATTQTKLLASLILFAITLLSCGYLPVRHYLVNNIHTRSASPSSATSSRLGRHEMFASSARTGTYGLQKQHNNQLPLRTQDTYSESTKLSTVTHTINHNNRSLTTTTTTTTSTTTPKPSNTTSSDQQLQQKQQQEQDEQETYEERLRAYRSIIQVQLDSDNFVLLNRCADRVYVKVHNRTGRAVVGARKQSQQAQQLPRPRHKQHRRRRKQQTTASGKQCDAQYGLDLYTPADDVQIDQRRANSNAIKLLSTVISVESAAADLHALAAAAATHQPAHNPVRLRANLTDLYICFNSRGKLDARVSRDERYARARVDEHVSGASRRDAFDTNWIGRVSHAANCLWRAAKFTRASERAQKSNFLQCACNSRANGCCGTTLQTLKGLGTKSAAFVKATQT